MMPAAKKREGQVAGNRPQGLGRLGGGVDPGDAMDVQRGGGRHDDEEGDQIREDDAGPGIERDMPEMTPRDRTLAP